MRGVRLVIADDHKGLNRAGLRGGSLVGRDAAAQAVASGSAGWRAAASAGGTWPIDRLEPAAVVEPVDPGEGRGLDRPTLRQGRRRRGRRRRTTSVGNRPR